MKQVILLYAKAKLKKMSYHLDDNFKLIVIIPFSMRARTKSTEPTAKSPELRTTSAGENLIQLIHRRCCR
jgi:hypothetical protein